MKSLKNHLALLAFCSAMLFIGCKKDCLKEGPPACADTPGSGQCLAYFESWFYDNDDNSCYFESYSGCSAVGFETRDACETCKCR